MIDENVYRLAPEGQACTFCGNEEQVQEDCRTCDGTGEVDDWEWPYCHECGGRGYIWMPTCYCNDLD
jgi:hypothetical protein